MLPEIITPIPGPRSQELAGKLKKYESRNVTYVSPHFPIFWERATGVNVWDVDGNRFLDLTSAFAVTGLGHGEPNILASMHEQSARLLHAMGDVHPTEAKVLLCQTLSEITFERWDKGKAKTILGCAGFEAIEAALKTAYLHNAKRGVIVFEGAYHGLGYGALETTGIEYFRSPFERQLGYFATRIPYPSCCNCPFGRQEAFRLEGKVFPNCSSTCLETLEKQIREAIQGREIGSILVEPLQGRGGDIAPPRDFLPMLRQICDEEKILLIFDEIYTGFNRTGKLFACEHFGVAPDIICLGKGLSSGFPISACVGRADIMDAWPNSTGEALHTSTFLGHPVGCAMALTSIEHHRDPKIAAMAHKAGVALRQALNQVATVETVDVRGAGLMLGMELKTPALAQAIVLQGLRDGMLLLAGGPLGKTLSFAPPFSISESEIAFVGKKLQEYLISLPGSIS